MPGKAKLIFVLVVIMIAVTGFVLINKPAGQDQKSPTQEAQNDQLKIVSTDPDPLDDATILPTQSITITFNKVIPKTEFKYKFEPEIAGAEVEALNGSDSTNGIVMKISFKKPLDLGMGFTLKILGSTRTDKKENLDSDYNYHIKTIQYKGV